jgi:hypothetical protein
MTFAFCFFEVSEWDVPIPTVVKSKVFGTNLSAFSAELANLILDSLTLTTYTLEGSLSVAPIPAKVVVPMPMACVVPAPACA